MTWPTDENDLTDEQVFEMWDERSKVCELCHHDDVGPTGSCGWATVRDQFGPHHLCHADDHSCYVRWTVYGERPEPMGMT